MGVLETLHSLAVAPVVDQLSAIFDLNGRIGLLFLAVSYAVAYGLFRYRKHRSLTDANSFWQFIGGGAVHWHPSALLDYRYYLVRGVLKIALLIPVVGWWIRISCARRTTSLFSPTCGAPGHNSAKRYRCRCCTDWAFF